MTDEPIAIIGLAGLFPCAKRLEEYWQNIISAADCIQNVPESHWKIAESYHEDRSIPGKTYSKRGGFIPAVEFDPIEYGIPPQQIEQIDCAQLLSLVIAKSALVDAGYAPYDGYPHQRTGVILGAAGTTMQLLNSLLGYTQMPLIQALLQEAGLSPTFINSVMKRYSEYLVDWKEDAFPGVLANVIAGRISNRFNLGGMNCTIDAACASSLAALNLAMMSLRNNQCDLIITGGIDVNNKLETYICFSKTPVLTRAEYAKPFDTDADGTIISEGLGMLVLKRLSDAERDHDRIYAVIKGIGTSSDGRSKSIFAPDKDGQMQAIQLAYQNANLSPQHVGLIEAHSPGTRTGDDIELDALTDIMCHANVSYQQVAIGSVKSQIGHTKAAAGAASLIKATLALYNKVIPPTIHVIEPNPRLLADDTPFYLNTIAKPWVHSKKTKRSAGVSSFGFGGANYHAVLEEYGDNIQDEYRFQIQTWPIILTASDESGLIIKCKNILSQLQTSNAERVWCDLFSDKQLIGQHDARLGFLSHDIIDTQKKLEYAIESFNLHCEKIHWHHPSGIWYRKYSLVGKVAAVFSGQGSQYPNMGIEFGVYHPEYRCVLEKIDHYFIKDAIKPVSEILFPKGLLNESNIKKQAVLLANTMYAQTSIGAFSKALYLYLKRKGLSIDCFMGHSFGELTALWAAGAFDDEAYNVLIYQRGKLFKTEIDHSTHYMMLAVQENDQNLSMHLPQDLYIANINSQEQTVIAGKKENLYPYLDHLKEMNIEYHILPVSIPFHTPLLLSLRPEWEKIVDTLNISKPLFPVYSNTSGGIHYDIKKYLRLHPFKTVHFRENIKQSYQDGVRTYIEIGPRSILGRFIEDTLNKKDVVLVSVNESRAKNSEVQLREAMLQLKITGVSLNGFQDEQYPKYHHKNDENIYLSGINYVSSERLKKINSKPNQLLDLNNHYNLSNTINIINDKTTSLHHDFIRIYHEQTNKIVAMLSHEKNREVINQIKILQERQQQFLNVHQNFINKQKNSDQILMNMLNKNGKVDNDILLNIDDNNEKFITIDEQKNDIKVEMKSNNLDEILLQLISEKTGYPRNVLTIDMQLESDLGIDSIKRIEIFSLLQQKINYKFKNEDIIKLKSIREIHDYLFSLHMPGMVDDTGDIRNNVFKILSEKTGYPENVLDVNMNLETDLGIDSIKRVEIFSILKIKNINNLNITSSIKSIKDIIDFLKSENSSNLEYHEKIIEKKQNHATLNDEKNILSKISLVKAPQVIKQFFTLQKNRSILIVGDSSCIHELIMKLKVTWPSHQIEKMTLIENQHGSLEESINKSYQQFCFKYGMPSICIYLPSKNNKHNLYTAILLAKYLKQDLTEDGHRACFFIVSSIDGKLGYSKNTSPTYFQAGLSGLIKTLCIEWPHVCCRFIDVGVDASADQTASIVINELLDSDISHSEIAYHNNERFTTKIDLLSESDQSQEEMMIKNDDVFLVTGGGSGITASCIKEMALQYQCTFVLLGRTEFIEDEPEWAISEFDEYALKLKASNFLIQSESPVTPQAIHALVKTITQNRQIKSTINHIRKSGGRADYIQFDITNIDAFAALNHYLDSNQLEITGIIHGAGILADKLVENKSEEDLYAVIKPKIDGLENILSMINKDELKFLILFSSTAAVYGNKGQGDYATANESLNKFSYFYQTTNPHCKVISINWGPWDNGMVNESLKNIFMKNGIQVITSELGPKLFIKLLKNYSHYNQIIVGNAFENTQRYYKASIITKNLHPKKNNYIYSHIINDTPVLPMAWIILWINEICSQLFPSYPFLKIIQLNLLKGIVFENDASEVYFLSYQVEKNHDGKLFALFSVYSERDNGKIVYHYKCQAVLSQHQLLPTSCDFEFEKLEDIEIQKYIKILYSGNYIKYGSAFQGVKSICYLDNNIIITKCILPQCTQENIGCFETTLFHPYSYDISTHGILILLLHHYKVLCLPSSIGSFQQYTPVPSEIPFYVKLEIKNISLSENNVIFNILSFNDEGEVYFRADDINMTLFSLDVVQKFREPIATNLNE